MSVVKQLFPISRKEVKELIPQAQSVLEKKFSKNIRSGTADREVYQVLKLYQQGDYSRQEAETQLLNLGFSADKIKQRLDAVPANQKVSDFATFVAQGMAKQSVQ